MAALRLAPGRSLLLARGRIGRETLDARTHVGAHVLPLVDAALRVLTDIDQSDQVPNDGGATGPVDTGTTDGSGTDIGTPDSGAVDPAPADEHAEARPAEAKSAKAPAAQAQDPMDKLRERLAELVCDGALVCTPAGSTAYNYSAHGPILPIGSDVLALTAMSAFRPRRWRGALLPRTAVVRFDVIEPDKRPVAAVADHVEVRHVRQVEIAQDHARSARILFDPGHSLAERVLREQFRF